MRSTKWIPVGLLLAIVCVAPAWAVIIYHEGFDSDQGTFTIENDPQTVPGKPPAGWAFDVDCPPAMTAPNGAGVLRWGAFQDCFVYGDHYIEGRAWTPVLSAFGEGGPCTLRFNYHLDFERPEDWETAEVEVSVEGGETQTLFDLQEHTLTSGATWLAAEAPLPQGEVQVTFVGIAGDGLFNHGTGWSIDDIEIDCPRGDVFTPATSSWGALVLSIGLGLAFSIAVLRRHRLISRQSPGA